MNAGIRRIGVAMIVLFVGLVAQLTYLQIGRGSQLANAPGNPRKAFADLRRDRGPIETADGAIVALSTASNDEYKHQRVYPSATATLFADVIGYQSIQNGAVGVEHTYSSALEGRTFDLQLNNLADAFANKQPVGTVVLTMTKAAQGAAAFALQGRRGSVVVLDVATGGVLAAYSNPTYDPNLLTVHDTKKAAAVFSFLSASPDNPLLSRSWRELYPPGSTFKTVTASIAQQSHVDLTTVFPVTDHIVLPQTNGVPLFNFGHERCGGSMLDSFIVSCNTTFAQVGLDLGETFATGIQKFGVQTQPPNQNGSGIDPAIVASRGPIPGTFQRNQPKFMQDAIGQNEVLVTPMEMALVSEAVANQGVILQPHVVDCVLDPSNRVVSRVGVQQYKRAIDPPTADTMRTFMLAVVNDPRGTGTAAQIPGVQVAGKTGTAETATGANPHAWFIAFAPADHPKYAIAVLVEHGGSDAAEATGGRVAAPIAKQVLQTLLSTAAPASPCGQQPGSPIPSR
ncbi:MAG TPA: penicillin-binding transpeptidase domain-containing protein [Acidimicrobiia bacterium]|jgi:peptidoglycan glycosyltransferase|nr:penicillin-binding transpeptidase domain-containing protein [Acidimicrobiia bacterium]